MVKSTDLLCYYNIARMASVMSIRATLSQNWIYDVKIPNKPLIWDITRHYVVKQLMNVQNERKIRISKQDWGELRNEFNFWNVHGIVHTSGHVQSKWSPTGFTLTLTHWRFGPYTPIFLNSRTLLLSSRCGSCSISAIGESNGKSQLAKNYQNSCALESYCG